LMVGKKMGGGWGAAPTFKRDDKGTMSKKEATMKVIPR